MNPQPVPDSARSPETPGYLRYISAVLSVLAASLFVTGLPAYYERFHSLSVIHAPAYREAARANLSGLGLSTSFYAAFYVALSVVFAAVCLGLATAIFWRRRGEPVALFVSVLLVLLGTTLTGTIDALGASSPVLRWAGSVLGALSLVSAFLFFYVFPDGRLVPRRARLPLAVYAACLLAGSFFPGAPFGPENGPSLPYFLLLLGGLLGGVIAQVYRYRRVSSPVERQQTKWVAFGFAAALAGYLGTVLALLPAVSPGFEPGSPADFASAAATVGFMLLIPLSIGFSILRYRLWDIDLVINRTLVYTLLSALLAAIYLVTVFVVQALLRTLSGQESQLAVVASTLVVAVLFTPLRHRLQSFIDRRFYRDKYDARKALDAFSERLRSEPDLDVLDDHLSVVVNETIRPAHFSVWLRPVDEVEGERAEGRR